MICKLQKHFERQKLQDLDHHHQVLMQYKADYHQTYSDNRYQIFFLRQMFANVQLTFVDIFQLNIEYF